MLIYKILRAAEWQALEVSGETAGAPIDVADGYIHFSTALQVRETAAKHFAGEEGLVLAAFDTETMGEALKWEVARAGAEFPHLYGPLRRKDIVWSCALPLVNGTHDFPRDMA